MNKEEEAVRKSLLMSGFLCGGRHFFFEDTSKTCYIPEDFVKTFDQAIEYMQTFAFHRFPNVEERKVYYHTARKLEKFRNKFKSGNIENW